MIKICCETIKIMTFSAISFQNVKFFKQTVKILLIKTTLEDYKKMSILSKKLKGRLIELGIKQGDLARMMSISEPTVSSWVNSSRCPDYMQIARMETLLKLPMGYLIHENLSDREELSSSAQYVQIPLMDSTEVDFWSQTKKFDINHFGEKIMILLDSRTQSDDLASYKMPDASMQCDGTLNVEKGDILLLSKADPIKHGSLVMIKYGEEFLIRQLDENQQAFFSQDASYPKISSGKAKVVAKVIKIYHEKVCP